MDKFHCVVCNRAYDGTTHCSVMACRACAMFFKRYQNCETIPSCKQKLNNCGSNSSSKFSCTSCRYQRCLTAGLSIQENARSSTTKQNKIEEVCSSKKCSFELNIDMKMLVSEKMPILQRFCYNYALNSNNQRKNELLMLQSDGEGLVSLPRNRQMCIMTQSRSNKLYEGCISGLETLVSNSFSVFVGLNSDAQDAIIHPLMVYYSDLCSAYKTLRTFNDINTTRLFCSELMYVDMNNTDSFMDQIDTLDPMDSKAIMDYFVVVWQNYLNTTLRVMHRMQITDVEFLAVSSLIIWDKDNFSHLHHLNKMADTHRQMIYHDLEYYYKHSLRLDNYVERVMNVHELIRTIKKNAVTMTEGVQFLRTFNYYKENEEMYDATQKIVGSVKSE